MTAPSGSTILTIIETVLLALAWCAVVRFKAYRRFPAFCSYLSCRLAVYGLLNILLQAVHLRLLEKHLAYPIYYYLYWGGYLLGAVTVFFAIQEIFTHLMEPLPNVGHFGLIAFRWVSLISVLIAVALAIFPVTFNQNLVVIATSTLMRCMSMLELCLLAFIVLSMQTLRISPRSRDFGVALGLAMIAVAELMGSALAFGHSTMTSVANYSCQVIATLASGVWLAYYLLPEERVQAVRLSVTLPWRRWNEVVNGLDEPPPQIAYTPSGDFFLNDVEKAVDRVLEKNTGKSAS